MSSFLHPHRKALPVKQGAMQITNSLPRRIPAIYGGFFNISTWKKRLKIKVKSEDFIVEEIADIPFKKKGAFGVYILKKRAGIQLTSS